MLCMFDELFSGDEFRLVLGGTLYCKLDPVFAKPLTFGPYTGPYCHGGPIAIPLGASVYVDVVST